jgi:two-component sensor histidine kinase
VAALNAELKAVSTRLLHNDDLLQGVLAGCGDCIKILDLDGRLQFMSEGGKRVMEVEDFSILKGCPWPDFWEGNGNVEAKAAIAAALRGETARFKGDANTAKGTPRYWDVQVSPILGDDGKPTHLLSISKDITEEHRSVQRLTFLTEELQHRIKNALTTVLAIANSTFRGAAHDEARVLFTSRIIAMDKANEILREASWQRAPVKRSIESALVPYRTGEGLFSISGPDTDVKPHQALAISLAVNELATNAIKYGSLSVPGGKVELGWKIEDAGEASQFVFRWQEFGGPPVAQPLRKGFGTRVIKAMLAQEFQGEVDLSYRPDGVTCTLTAPSANLAASG